MENSAKVREYLRECGVFYIATEDARQPRVRPLNGIYLYEGKLCIFTPKDSPLYKRLKADPQMEICATHRTNPGFPLSEGSMKTSASACMKPS